MNWIFLGLLVVSVLMASFAGTMHPVMRAGVDSAKAAVELAIGLVGQMTLWLGFFGVLRQAGVLKTAARALAPLMRRLFPEVPVDHPAMGAMILNLSANMLGLGNAATPFGLKAMNELDSLNQRRGVATNSMALFLVINTAGVAVLPLSTIAQRAALGSKDPAGIVVPTLLATACSTLIGIMVCKFLERRRWFAVDASPTLAEAPAPPKQPDAAALTQAEALAALEPSASPWRAAISLAVVAALGAGLFRWLWTLPGDAPAFETIRGILSDWLLPLIMLSVVLLGFTRRVRVYEAFIPAAKEGFQVGITIIPYLVAMLVPFAMFRASGAMGLLSGALSHLVGPLGFPPEALPMALIRPLSGSAALGVMADVMKTHGPDSFVGYLVSVMNGSTETTFYVLALYFGAVQVKAIRHTLAACLVIDVVGPTAAFIGSRLFFGGP